MSFSTLAAPSKAQYDEDRVEAVRSPDNLRPLSGHSSDAKASAGRHSHVLNSIVTRLALGKQRGFVKHWRFTDNIVK